MNANAYDNAGLLSRLLYLYVVPFLWQNYQKEIHQGAIGPCSEEDQCEMLAEKLRRTWSAEQHSRPHSPRLLCALYRSFGSRIHLHNCKHFLVHGVFQLALPLLLGRIIHYSSLYYHQTAALHEATITITTTNATLASAHHATQPTLSAIKLSIVTHSLYFIMVLIFTCIASHDYFLSTYRLGVQVRSALTLLIYEKSLRLSSGRLDKTQIATITNLVNTDASRFDSAYQTLGHLLMAPIETAIALALLYGYIGAASAWAAVVMLFYVLIQIWIAYSQSQLKAQTQQLTENRLRLMMEIFQSIRVIKMAVWEGAFARLVHQARKMEIAKLQRLAIIRAISHALFISNKILLFVCVITFIWYGGQLTSEMLFVTIGLTLAVRQLAFTMFPMGISGTADALVSIERIEKFLLEEEYQPLDQFNGELPTERGIIVSNLTVNSSNSSTPILRDISFKVNAGMLTIVIGPIGAGKSALLLSILNENVGNPGTISVRETVAYVEQEAWIQRGTIRENILLGKPFDRERYLDVIQVTCLDKDLSQFERGDQMQLEDGGSTLSGGQRARISLARAVYADADCYLLDDALSSCDAAVAKDIFHRCIQKYLADKCVLLVTHQLQFIEQADYIIILKNGACFAKGTYAELVKQGIDFFKYSISEKSQYQQMATSPDVCFPKGLAPPDFAFFRRSSRASILTSSDSEYMPLLDEHSLIAFDMSNETNEESPLPSPEAAAPSEPVQSPASRYWKYFSASKSWLLVGTFTTFGILLQIAQTGSDYWLAIWTDHKESGLTRSTFIASEDSDNIALFSCLLGALFLFSIIRTAAFYLVCMKSSIHLHDSLFKSLIHAPISFFDRTPLGSIICRISSDIAKIDNFIPVYVLDLLDSLSSCTAVLLLLVALDGTILLPLAILLVIIFACNRFYIGTSQKLIRLVAEGQGPLYGQLNSSLNGLISIRSYRIEKLLLRRFADAHDQQTATYFLSLSASRLYCLVMDLIGICYVFCTMAVMLLHLDSGTSGLMGLAISQALLLTGHLNWGFRLFSNVELLMTSVERVVEYIGLPKEIDESPSELQLLPADWPASGAIEFRNVSLTYSNEKADSTGVVIQGCADDQPASIEMNPNPEPSHTVLNNLNFTIKGGEKAGVVGRTGAGKSSLIVVLFRLKDPGGSILIDGVDTKSISLARLRQSLSIIPQEPRIFSGTIRHNLDPFNEKTDEELWDAIGKVQLGGKIESLPGRLGHCISGTTFSVGERQLICLARALLRKHPARILVFDEATSSVDSNTDALIQETLRNEFAECTVLTIAHRLNTIIDYDRVMVLDSGYVVQFDTPYELIKDKTGMFHDLYSNLNRESKKELSRVAEDAHYRRKVDETF